MSGRSSQQRAMPSETECAPATCTPQAIPGYPGTPGGRPAWSCGGTGHTCYQTATLTAQANTRNGCTQCDSLPPSYGATTPIQTWASASTPGKATSKRPDETGRRIEQIRPIHTVTV